jgi:hypothetical protein
VDVPAAGSGVVKFSSWPDPQRAGNLVDTLRACAAITAQLAAPAGA